MIVERRRQSDNTRYRATRLDALIRERDRLREKGVGPDAPRIMKLSRMIAREYRLLGQLELFS